MDKPDLCTNGNRPTAAPAYKRCRKVRRFLSAWSRKSTTTSKRGTCIIDRTKERRLAGQQPSPCRNGKGEEGQEKGSKTVAAATSLRERVQHPDPHLRRRAGLPAGDRPGEFDVGSLNGNGRSVATAEHLINRCATSLRARLVH